MVDKVRRRWREAELAWRMLLAFVHVYMESSRLNTTPGVRASVCVCVCVCTCVHACACAHMKQFAKPRYWTAPMLRLRHADQSKQTDDGWLPSRTSHPGEGIA